MRNVPGRILQRLLVGLGVTAAVLVLVTGWLWWLGGGTPTVSVDYVAKLNERSLHVAEPDRAWPIYQRAAAGLPSGEALKAFDDLFARVSPGDERWAECVSTLADHEETLRLIREGAAKAGTGIILGASPEGGGEGAGGEPDRSKPTWVVQIVLPQLGEFRRMARLLRADALHAAELGDRDRAAADLEALAGLGRHAREHPILISQLVSKAIGALASECTREIIHGFPGVLDEDALRRVDAAIAGAFTGPETALDLTGERYFFLDVIQRVYSDDGRGNGRVTAHGLEQLAPVIRMDPPMVLQANRVATGFASLFSKDRAEITALVNRIYDGLEAYGKTPGWQRGPNEIDAEVERMYAERRSLDVGELLVSMLMPALGRATVTTERSVLDAEATRVVIALERFRLANGRWPDELGQLVPRYLGSLPLDLFTGESLRYGLGAPGPVLYSLGVDRDDDGGRPAARARDWASADRAASFVAEKPDERDGDWVLYPPAADE